MNRTFKRLSDKVEVDLIEYVKQWLEDHPEGEVYVGSDGQDRKKKTMFATVVVLHTSRGGHVLYSEEITKRATDMNIKLWHEVELSLEVAQYMVDSGLPAPDRVEIDINPDEKWGSNVMLASALGMITWKGFNGQAKPNAPAASNVADKICKKIKPKRQITKRVKK